MKQKDVPTPDAAETPIPACASCHVAQPKRACRIPEGVAGKACPTEYQAALLAAANAEYADPAVAEFARQASLQEAACYANRHERPYVMQPSKTRIQEICEVARRMGYQEAAWADAHTRLLDDWTCVRSEVRSHFEAHLLPAAETK